MKIFFRSILLIISLVSILFGYHNHINFQHIGIDDGLSQSSVTDIVQDNKGYLWFATQDGLNKYDGYNITQYKNDPRDSLSLTSNYISCIMKDSKGMLWIGTMMRGISRYNPKLDIFNNFFHKKNDSSSISSNRVYEIYEDSNNDIWLATANGLDKYDRHTKQFDHYTIKSHDTKNVNSIFRSIYEDTRGNFWLGSFNGLYRFDRRKKEFLRISQEIEKSHKPGPVIINVIVEDSRGFLWLGTEESGAFKIDYQGNIIEKYIPDDNDPNSISGATIRDIFQDSEGNLWIATYQNGMNEYNYESNGFTVFNYNSDTQRGLQSNTFLSMYEDREGNVWFGSSDGAHFFNRKVSAFHHYQSIENQDHGLSNDDIWETYKDKSKNIIWVGTSEGGLNKFDPETETFTVFKHDENNPNSLASNTVYSVYHDSRDNYWIGTSQGLDLFDPKTGTFKHYKKGGDPNSLNNNIIGCIYEDSRRNLWVGTNRGLHKFDYQIKNFKVFHNNDNKQINLGNKTIYTIFEDSDDMLWIGTSGNGLYRYDRNTNSIVNYIHHQEDTTSISSNIIVTILEDSFGNLWIGTAKGLNKYIRDKNEFKTFYETDGLADDMIYGLLTDKNNNLWLSTNNGLTRYNPSTDNFTNFSEEDGLHISEFNMGAYCKDEDGRLYFGGVDGFTVFDPDKVKKNNFEPPVAIVDFLLFNHSISTSAKKPENKDFTLKHTISYTDKITLDYDDYIFSFEFSALNFWYPEKNRYRYKLEGFDKEWINTDSRHRRATYTNIPPGDYKFHVQASNSAGYWSETTATVALTIVPPFWMTKTFIGLVVITLILSIFGVYRYRTYQIQAHNKELEEKVKDRTKEIQSKTEELEKLSIVASKTDNAIIISDAEGNFEWINEGFTRLYGWEWKDLQHEFSGNLVEYSSNDNIEELIKKCKNEKISLRYETKSRTKSGKHVYSQTTLTPIIDKQGKVQKLIAIDTDITELVKTRKKAEQANQAKSDFLSNMSHEIRTPLNGIIGFTDLLMDTKLNDLQFEYMETVNNSANSLLGLINDILDFSKIEAGKMELEEGKFDLIELSEGIIDIFKGQAREKDIELLLNISPEIPRYVFTDQVRLRQVIVNLLGNAIKFTQKGEVEFGIERQNQPESDQIDLIFYVSDTGIGISREQESRIFDSFSQADASTTRKFGGTGLGLSISNKILQHMNSNLQLDSQIGKGSKFYFRLSLPYEFDTSYIPEDIDFKNVLVVDNNSKNLNNISRMLNFSEIKINTAQKGQRAIDKLHNNGEFDLIIMDYELPDINGMEVIRETREKLNSRHNEPPVILLHNYTDEKRVCNECKRLGISSIISKPVKMTKLFYHINQLDSDDENTLNCSKTQTETGRIKKFENTPYKILIVEDNKSNMLFTKTVVKKLLPESILIEASTGQEAISRFEEHADIDLIFMDIQMPKLNGYEATREIRSRESAEPVPIIALTAGAVKGEEEKSKNAGMDDYVTKPVKAEVIKNTLLRWLTKRKITKPFTPPQEQNDLSPAIEDFKRELKEKAVFDSEDLEERLLDDKELVEELLINAMQDLPGQIENLNKLIKDGDAEKIELQAHSIKGSASNISADALTHVSLKIEKAGAAGDIELSRFLFPELKREFKILQKAVDKYIE